MTMLTVYVCFKLGVMVGKTEERELQQQAERINRRVYEMNNDQISFYRERNQGR